MSAVRRVRSPGGAPRDWDVVDDDLVPTGEVVYGVLWDNVPPVLRIPVYPDDDALAVVNGPKEPDMVLTFTVRMLERLPVVPAGGDSRFPLLCWRWLPDEGGE